MFTALPRCFERDDSCETNFKAALIVAASAALALSACSTQSDGGDGDGGETISVNAFSVMEAANEPVFEDFEGTDDGDGVTFETSYGASGDQSRAVVAGADADVVHYSLETDVTRLVDEGLVAEDWKDNATNGIATSSVVVFVVRKGNPDGIETWDDLVKPGVEIITPEPRLVRLGALEHPVRLGARHRQRRQRGRRQGVPHQAAQQHHRPPGQRSRGHHGLHRRQRRRPPLLRERGDPRQAERCRRRLRPAAGHPAHREPGRGDHRRE